MLTVEALPGGTVAGAGSVYESQDRILLKRSAVAAKPRG
jgi:hypothetical protein